MRSEFYWRLSREMAADVSRLEEPSGRRLDSVEITLGFPSKRPRWRWRMVEERARAAAAAAAAAAELSARWAVVSEGTMLPKVYI